MAFNLFNPGTWFGGGEDSQPQSQRAPSINYDEILAPIRQRLTDLAGKISEITTQRAGDIKSSFENARTRGLTNIREGLYGNRGFGATSLEPMYNTDLLTGLATQEESALSANELAGLTGESNILRGAGALGLDEARLDLSNELGLDRLYSSIGQGIGAGGGGDIWSLLQNIIPNSGYGGGGDGQDGGDGNWLDTVLKIAPAIIQMLT